MGYLCASQIQNLAEQEMSATMEYLLRDALEHNLNQADVELTYLSAELDRIHVVMGNEYRSARAARDAEKRRSAKWQAQPLREQLKRAQGIVAEHTAPLTNRVSDGSFDKEKLLTTLLRETPDVYFIHKVMSTTGNEKRQSIHAERHTPDEH